MATNNAINVGLSGASGIGLFVGSAGSNLITPSIGTPSAAILTGCTGYALANVAGLGANVGTFLTTPTSANFKSAITNPVGSGNFVFETDTTYTPSFAFGGGSTGITYTTQAGFYSRVGNTITFTFTLTLSSVGSSTGNVFVTAGLPVAARASSMNIFSVTCDNITFSGSYLEAQATGATASLSINYVNSTSGRTILTNTGMANTSSLTVSGIYLV